MSSLIAYLVCKFNAIFSSRAYQGDDLQRNVLQENTKYEPNKYG